MVVGWIGKEEAGRLGMDPEGDLVESGGGQEDGWDISLEVRVCPYID